MYALMKANLFVHFPGHVIKYRGFSKRRKKTIDEYLNLQQDGRAMIAPSTERVPSLAERVASLRYSINLRFLNNRVPALKTILLGLLFPMFF